MTLSIAPEVLTGFLLALVRSAAWIFVMPPFGSRMFPTIAKVGFAAAITIALGPRLAEQAVPLDTVSLATAALLQVAAGLALGFVGVLLFSAVQAAGGLIDLFGGFSAAQQLDPVSGVANSVFGRFYNLLAVTLVFAIDGHLLLVRGFLRSFDAAPLTDLSLDGMAELVTGDLTVFFVAAVEIAAPLLAALFLAEVALGLLARAAPQLNVFLLGLPLKILLTIALAALAVPLLPDAVGSLLRPIVDHGLQVVGAGGA